jgi:hypothetical protein
LAASGSDHSFASRVNRILFRLGSSEERLILILDLVSLALRLLLQTLVPLQVHASVLGNNVYIFLVKLRQLSVLPLLLLAALFRPLLFLLSLDLLIIDNEVSHLPENDHPRKLTS